MIFLERPSNETWSPRINSLERFTAPDYNLHLLPHGIKATRSYDWTLTLQTLAPDGFAKVVIAVNGMIPGPLIEVNEGDRLIVNVTNMIEEPTSIHWHGLNQRSSQSQDGVGGFSQCPIPHGSNYVYDFEVNGQSGTYWWHSHSGLQYTDGLAGPLIVHGEDSDLVPGKDYDYDKVIFYQDWFHNSSKLIEKELLSSRGYEAWFFNSSKVAPSPQSGLINGVGVYERVLTYTMPNCKKRVLPVIDVLPHSRVRLRFINGASHSQGYLSVDKHPLTLVEVDDTTIEGLPNLHRVATANGQRASAILKTDQGSDGDTFFLRIQMHTGCISNVDPSLNPTTSVILRYNSGNTTEFRAPKDQDWDDPIPEDCGDIPTSEMVPRFSRDPPPTASQVEFLNTRGGMISVGGEEFFRFFSGNLTGISKPNSPMLHRIVDEGVSALDDGMVDLVVFDDKTISADLCINNMDFTLAHPVHLHAYTFWIVGEGPWSITPSNYSSVSSSFNVSNPLRRDTYIVRGSSWACLRILNDIPGVWPFHCFHLSQGFMAAVVSQPNTARQIGISQQEREICQADFDMGYSENERGAF
ncbi:hypothetical protein IE53DRAFT_314201 [Violaceomyces palustris]|uniref:Uncharacterized protein n=1 Tax=Violaceomyces palustris TaxID=1673888 RepID=A0ACD0NZL1_9BASI|nr:hypothetical protein IE53DRAFT_314201 [Violaceomyces palustris]